MVARLDPTLDAVFHLLLANERNKVLLISLLEAVLQTGIPISEVTVQNPKLAKELVNDRGAELDVFVRLRDGRRVNVEMQSRRLPGIRERALFYWAGMYRSQLGRGGDYTELAPCVSVFILKWPELAGRRYHSTFRLLEVHDQVPFSQALELHTLELSKLPARESGRREASVVNWGRFLTARSDEELEELCMVDPVFEKAKEALDLLSADPEAQELARRRQEAQWSYRTGLKLARAEGLREGVRVACDLLGIELDATRQRAIDDLDPAQLETLLAALRRDRRWPRE